MFLQDNAPKICGKYLQQMPTYNYEILSPTPDLNSNTISEQLRTRCKKLVGKAVIQERGAHIDEVNMRIFKQHA